MLAAPRGVHLRLDSVRGLPVPPSVAALARLAPNQPHPPGELQLAVSLFDEATGAFFGNTCHSEWVSAADRPRVAPIHVKKHLCWEMLCALLHASKA